MRTFTQYDSLVNEVESVITEKRFDMEESIKQVLNKFGERRTGGKVYPWFLECVHRNKDDKRYEVQFIITISRLFEINKNRYYDIFVSEKLQPTNKVKNEFEKVIKQFFPGCKIGFGSQNLLLGAIGGMIYVDGVMK